MTDRNVKIVLSFQAAGADAVRSATRGVATQVDDLAKKLRAADFSVVGDIERKLRAADFGAAARGVDTFTKSVGLSRQQSLALTYTINDVIASLASGSSIFTIAAQQGGQLTQAFGGVRNTFASLAPTIARFAPLVAVATAALAAFSAVKFASGVAQQIKDVQQAADEAGIAVDKFQKLKGAATQSGLDADGFISALKSIGDASKKSEGDVGDLASQIVQSTNMVREGSAHFEDGKLSIQKYGEELRGVERIAATLGVSLRDAFGQFKDSTATMFELARALTQIKDPALQAQAAVALFGSKGAASILPAVREGISAINELEQRYRNFKPEFDPAAIKRAREFQRAWTELKETLSQQVGVNIDTAGLDAGIATVGFLKEAVRDIASFWRLLRNEIGQPILEDATAAFESLRATASTAFDSLRTAASSAFDSIGRAGAALGEVLAALDFGGVFSTTWETLKAGATDALQFITDKLRQVQEAARSIANALGFGSANGDPAAPTAPPERDVQQEQFRRQVEALQRRRDQQLQTPPALSPFPPPINPPPPAAPQQRSDIEPQADQASADLASVGAAAQQAAQPLASVGQTAQQAGSGLASIAQAVQSASGALQQLPATLGSAPQAIQSAGESLAAAIQQVASSVQQAAASITTAGGGASVAAASGGHIRGPGTGTSDSILARLSNGEFVIRARAVSKFGPGFFQSLNNLRMPSFATGGLVGVAPSLSMRFAALAVDLPRYAAGGLASLAADAMPAGGGGGRPLTVVMDGSSFGPFTGPTSAIDEFERHVTRRQISAATKRSPSWRK